MLRKAILVVLSLYLISIIAIYMDSLSTRTIDAEYGIIYGNKVNEDGSLSNRLKARLDAALNLYRTNKVNQLIVSGGIGKEGFDEAKAMHAYLIKQGIPTQAILLDNDGYTTSQTSFNAAALIGINHSVVAITQQFHVSRTKLSLRHAGFKQVNGYYPHYFEPRDIYSMVREVPAWLKYWFFNR